MRFPQLPVSLLLACVALVVTALPASAAELKVLTPEDFDITVANGVWLVEHFSPYCGHCRKFAPTWEKLVEETEKAADPGIHLAQVNCAVHGDLCDAHKINGYPQINLYRNGEFVETYKKARDHDLLTNYIAQHAEPNAPQPSTPAPAADSNPPPPSTPGLDYNSGGTVLVLDSSSFDTTLRQGPAFVKFYAPWCGHCKKLAPHWTQLARHMQHRLTVAEVDCEDQPAVCKREGVTGYPMLFFYGPTGAKTEYTGGRKFEHLSAFADKANAPAVQEVKDSELDEKIKENEVVFLFLHTTADSKQLNELTLAAQSLLGVAPVFTSTSPLLHTRFFPNPPASLPALLALKDHDTNVPIAMAPVGKAQTGDAMRTWLNENKLPSALELTAEAFQGVMNAPHSPLVVLVAVPKDASGYAAQVREIAKQWKERADGKRPVVFAWMDQDRWASWLKSMYGVTEAPAVVIVEHKRLVYYDNDEFGQKIQLSSASVFSAVEGVLKGTIAPIHSENIIERMARFLNDRLTSLESIITNNPITVIFIVVCVVGLIILGVKRMLAEELIDDYPGVPSEGKSRKSRRVD